MLSTETFLQAGEPAVHRGITIVPLFPRLAPRAAYLTLDEALPAGLTIAETSQAGTVPELAVHNPLGERVLLYDGEELAGAKQNRILDVTVLVEARSTLTVPVSCVEQGRWQHVSPGFAAAPQTAHPELRRRKALRLQNAPLVRGGAQGEVWDAVAEKARRMGVASPTSANADTFRAHAGRLDRLEAHFPAEKGQSGALLALGDTLCLDWVSRPEAFVRLWPKLRRGYLLDALEALDRPPAAPGGGRALPGTARHRVCVGGPVRGDRPRPAPRRPGRARLGARAGRRDPAADRVLGARGRLRGAHRAAEPAPLVARAHSRAGARAGLPHTGYSSRGSRLPISRAWRLHASSGAPSGSCSSSRG